MRGGWRESSAAERAGMSGQHRFQGRVPDGRFYLERPDGEERLLLNLWLAPWTFAGEPLWVAQSYYRHVDSAIVAALREADLLDRESLLSRFVRQAVSADIDSARLFVVQNLWYNQAVRKVGFLPGVGAHSVEAPGATFEGLGFVTNGNRTVLFLSDVPVAMGNADILFRAASAGTPGSR